MPTYRLTAPDGKVYNVTGEGTGEEALARLQSELSAAPPQNSEPSAVAEPVAPQLPNSIGAMGAEAVGNAGKFSKDALVGTKKALQSAAAGLTGMLPRGAEEFLVKHGLSPSQEMLDANKQAYEQAGPGATTGQMATDIGMQIAPSNMLTKAVQAAKTVPAMGRAALNMLGQGGINAAVTPTSEDRGMAAAVGAGGTAAGGLLARVAGGPMRNLVTPEARQLLDAGIPLTPGQAVSGPSAGWIAKTVRGTEDSAGSIPAIGDLLRAKQRSAANAFSLGEINKALKPIGQKVEGAGHEALDGAMDAISNSYNHALPHISVPNASLSTLVDDAVTKAVAAQPFFNEVNEKVLRTYYKNRIAPLAAQGKDLDGPLAKKLDAEIGEKIRDYRKGGNAESLETRKALILLRDELRAAMQGATPEARQALKDADMARAKIQPILETADEATGEFTAKALNKAGVKADNVDKFHRAAAQVLPAITPDSGTAGRTAVRDMLTAPSLGAGAATGASVAGLGLLPTIAGLAGIGAAYTKPGMKYLTEGVHPLMAKARGAGYSPDELEAAIKQLISQPIRAGYNARGE